jgi:hypothetical protein
VIDYDHASVATHTEAEEIVAEANDFFELVEHWIAANRKSYYIESVTYRRLHLWHLWRDAGGNPWTLPEIATH